MGPIHPNRQPGDYVFGEVDNGFDGALRIGEISIEADMDADQVYGALQANWLSSDVLLRCEIWSFPEAPWLEMLVDPHGGAYTCDFAPTGWDLLPDQMIAVTYFTPHGSPGDQYLGDTTT